LLQLSDLSCVDGVGILWAGRLKPAGIPLPGIPGGGGGPPAPIMGGGGGIPPTVVMVRAFRIGIKTEGDSPLVPGIGGGGGGGAPIPGAGGGAGMTAPPAVGDTGTAIVAGLVPETPIKVRQG
jgi:hypothetical protein